MQTTSTHAADGATVVAQQCFASLSHADDEGLHCGRRGFRADGRHVCCGRLENKRTVAFDNCSQPWRLRTEANYGADEGYFHADGCLLHADESFLKSTGKIKKATGEQAMRTGQQRHTEETPVPCFPYWL